MNGRAQLRLLALGAMFAMGLSCAGSQPVDPTIDIMQGGDATGGTPGTGGITSTGGTPGTGGITSTGGIKGTGGITSTGGTPGTGGIQATGGKGGTTTGGGGHAGAMGGGGHAGVTGGGGGRAGTTGTVGTGGRGGAAGGATGAGGATTTATFTQIYTTILSKSCTGAQCHNPGNQQGFSVSSQANAYTTSQSFIIPGDSYGSTFWEAVDTGNMPRNAAKLSAANIALIGAWIDAGAENN
jgi:hypothetical protein